MPDRQDALALRTSPPWGDDGHSVVDLAGVIARRFGAEAASPGLADLRVSQALAEAKQLVLLLFDGLGTRQLQSLIPGGALAGARSSALHSVFPSSTAPSISSFASACHPAQHATPGWFCWSEEFGTVVRTLPMDRRAEPGAPVEAQQLYDWQSASRRFGVPVVAIQPDAIADSEFSRHAWSGATRLGYGSASELPDLVERVLRARPKGAFVWVYLPHFDAKSHERGWQSEQAAATASRMDELFSAIGERLQPTGALLLATADHGFIDVPATQQLRLEAFPGLAALLSRPLTGETRVVFCQARTGAHEAFAEKARAELGFAFDVVSSEALISAGWFGPGPVSPRLAARLGSHTLIARDHYTLVDQLPGEPPVNFIGMHGGTHEDELSVPLAALWRGHPL
jgi:hypothetical protein